MGVGGHFWDLLKPYARTEDFDFLRDKRVAVDLSFWIVQHETAIRAHARNPHLRLTFFRTINLFSKFGAFPVFVVDGTPSPLKSKARIARFFRASGLDLSSLPVPEEGVSIERNPAFLKCVRECVELLELLGMPILKAKAEAEALCAQLNSEGQVDACITADSDAFLFGAHCVVKLIRPNSKEPFECYRISDIEAGLGLKRNHLIAISLLVGNDHDLNGVQGIGLDTALRFVKCFSEDEILTRLSEIGRGDTLQFQGGVRSFDDAFPSLHENSPKKKSLHCSFCGHPGSKSAHLKLACEFCSSSTSEACRQKPVGFKCDCTSCDLERRDKEQKKKENWETKVCQKIAMEQNFPNVEIIEMYLSNNYCDFPDDGPNLSWETPKTELLVDHLSFYQQWEPSYIRQRMLPMLSTIFLREMASNPKNDLLYDQYEFHSIQRLKIRYGHQFFLVKWKKCAPAMDTSIYTVHTKESEIQLETSEHSESPDPLNEIDSPQICLDDGCWYLSTDENMELVKAAFPEKVDQFLKEKELKEMKSRRKKSGVESGATPQNSESPKPKNVQLSITEFYRSKKVLCQAKRGDDLADNSENGIGSSDGKRKGHYMLNSSINEQLVGVADVKEGDLVLEIGPGTGSLTNVLVNAGATVLAIEKDPHMAALVTERFESTNRVKVLQEDFTTCHIHSHLISLVGCQKSLDGESQYAKVVSNLPFNITTDVVKLLLPMGDIFSDVVLLLQEETASRFVDSSLRTSEYRPISVFINFYSDPEYNFKVPRSNFFPQPNVDAAVVTFRLKQTADYPPVSSTKSFFSMVNSAFNGKRKMLRRSLQHICTSLEIEAALENVGLPATSRPEELTLDNFVKLHNLISKT